MYPGMWCFHFETICQKTVITDLILVHVLIVNLKRMGRQLLCLVQFPIKGWRKKRRHMRNSDNEIYWWKGNFNQSTLSEWCKWLWVADSVPIVLCQESTKASPHSIPHRWFHCLAVFVCEQWDKMPLCVCCELQTARLQCVEYNTGNTLCLKSSSCKKDVWKKKSFTQTVFRGFLVMGSGCWLRNADTGKHRWRSL